MKLNARRTILVGLAFLSISAFWQLYDSLIPLILKNTFQVSDTISGGIMAIDNVLAVFMLPLFGSLSDRVHTRIGRRMPFILCGTAAAVVAMLFLPFSDNIGSLALFVTALFVTLIAMGSYRSPAVSLMPDVTPKPLRSKANAIINLMGAVGGVISLILISALVPKTGKPDYFPIFLIVAAVMVLSVLLLLWKVRENPLREEREKIDAGLSETEKADKASAGRAAAGQEASSQPQGAPAKTSLDPAVRKSLILILISVACWFMGYNAVTTAFSRYAQIYWGIQGGGFANCLLIATAAAILSYIPVGSIASRVGRKKTILGGVILLASMFAIGATVKEYHVWINGLFALVGVAWAAINVNSYPMVVEMSKGSDIGKFTGFYYTFSMAAQIVTPILSGFLLEHVGYFILFPYAALFVVIAFFTMLFVRHGDSRPLPKKSRLEAFNTDD
ncbi:MAG TPA: MFS transporter [Candidatus Eisenbergiella stercorigallinarum]|uniref:MFS transporter n=1 Tax=Candidatus Eisenbergiella stercorigallinarum TaxID=2838557 RepID=A0A9D2R4R4_9FIRM|nr:MFS transporter [Candidatus Eisenbergiella stercorigallinarum]